MGSLPGQYGQLLSAWREAVGGTLIGEADDRVAPAQLQRSSQQQQQQSPTASPPGLWSRHHEDWKKQQIK